MARGLKENLDNQRKDPDSYGLETIPDRSTDEGLATLRSRREALEGRRKAVEQRWQDIQRQMLESRRSDSIEFLVESFLRDPEISPPWQHSLREELGMLDQTRNGLRQALERIDFELLDCEARLDAAACRAVAALHRRNVRDTINKMLAVHQSIVKQDNLRLELNARGVHRTGQLLAFAHGDFWTGAADIHSWISGQLRDLVGFGFLKEEERAKLQHGEISELEINSGDFT